MFWSSNKILAQQAEAPLVVPFNPDRIQQGSYELSMGPQAAISCDGKNQIINLDTREDFCIPPGQFALLLSEEKVDIPTNVIAFISLKTSVKSAGLVNVSGFHVDPGYKCRLKFWVYNAGNQDIPILRGDAVFLIWFSDLDGPTKDPYQKNADKWGHNEITSGDLRGLRGHLASPAALLEQVNKLSTKLTIYEGIGTTAIVILIGLCVALVTPLLDYIVKPVIERFVHANPAAISTIPAAAPANATTVATVQPAIAPSFQFVVPIIPTVNPQAVATKSKLP